MRTLTAIDLFAGCGGLSVGLKRAGFRVLAAIEADRLAASTYRLNHRGTEVMQEDIRRVAASSLMKQLGLRRGVLDLLAGCPPCQGYSTLRTKNGHRRNKEGSKDLLFELMRFVRRLLPRSVMIENVPGLTKDRRLTSVCRELESLGYRWTYSVMNAADYGVPQRRKRMILLASRLGEVNFADKARRMRTVRDAIGFLPKPGRSGDVLHDHAVNRSREVQALIKQIPKNGGSRTALPLRDQLACHKRSDGFRDIYGRMSWDQPSPTITGGCINPSKGRFLHPTQNRAITLREAALLQGFPKNYVLSLEQGHYLAAQMIGNAFPPEFAARHARRLATVLRFH